MQVIAITVCNFQSMKNPVELDSLLSKLFCYIPCFAVYYLISPDQAPHQTTCKRGLYVKSYCFFEIIAQRFKNYKLITSNFSVFQREASVKSAFSFITSSIVTHYLLALKVLMFRKYIFARCSLIFKISFEYFVGTHYV